MSMAMCAISRQTAVLRLLHLLLLLRLVVLRRDGRRVHRGRSAHVRVHVRRCCHARLRR